MNCPGAHVRVSRGKALVPRPAAADRRIQSAAPRRALRHAARADAHARDVRQDDAHIFCTEDQIEDEVALNLQMVRDVYSTLGFEQVEFKLATMPEDHLGAEEQWRATEAKLASAMERNRIAFQINPREGAFYGPQDRDLRVRRAQAQMAACDHPARLQSARRLRSDLCEQRRHRRLRPVMIHRAILGSLERFIGVLIDPSTRPRCPILPASWSRRSGAAGESAAPCRLSCCCGSATKRTRPRAQPRPAPVPQVTRPRATCRGCAHCRL